MFDVEKYKDDFDLFTRETATVDIAKGGDKYFEYHRYILESLDLIVNYFPQQAHAWHSASIACMDKSISLDEARKIDFDIRNYRMKILGAGNHMPDVKNQTEALTFLFQFAVEHPDDPNRLHTSGTDISNGTSLIQAIDEYS
ncbi:MAG TPA: hypothetical protein VNW52_03890, partial [Burkholderiaceae bacterium]|nr:hypothetical protein [Burkholderiaceae bacterium]